MTLDLIPVLLVIPLAWAILSLLLPRTPAALLAVPGMLLQGLAAVLLSWQIYHGGPLDYALGDWLAPLGISLIADGFSVTLLTLTSLIALICGVYALFYLRSYPREQVYFWPLFWFLLAALNGIWLAGDLFNLYVGLELLGLAAVGMVALTGDRPALSAALRYLYAALLGSLLYLLGVALIYGSYGTLALPQLTELLSPGLTTAVAMGLMTLGLLLKTAIFPFHFWLPPAHGGALAPVSALLSALVVKASFYIVARLWLEVGPEVVAQWAAQLLGMLGVAAILWGSWQAFRTPDIKMLVAWSTVAQLGYLMFVFPLAIGVGEQAAGLAWQGTLLHLLAHAFAKAAMFLAVGALVLAVGTKTIADLAGISRKMPLSLFAFGLAGVSLMGLPPSGGFNAKWLLLQSAAASGQWHWFAMLVLGGLLTAAYVFRVFRVSFNDEPAPTLKAVPVTLQLTAFLLAALAILLGFASMVPLTLMELTELSDGAMETLL